MAADFVRERILALLPGAAPELLTNIVESAFLEFETGVNGRVANTSILVGIGSCTVEGDGDAPMQLVASLNSKGFTPECLGNVAKVDSTVYFIYKPPPPPEPVAFDVPVTPVTPAEGRGAQDLTQCINWGTLQNDHIVESLMQHMTYIYGPDILPPLGDAPAAEMEALATGDDNDDNEDAANNVTSDAGEERQSSGDLEEKGEKIGDEQIANEVVEGVGEAPVEASAEDENGTAPVPEQAGSSRGHTRTTTEETVPYDAPAGMFLSPSSREGSASTDAAAKDWNEKKEKMAKSDLVPAFHRLMSNLTELVGKNKQGTIVLYVPASLANSPPLPVHRDPEATPGKDKALLPFARLGRDSALVQQLEAIVVQWTRQVRELLIALDAGIESDDLGPRQEVDFWAEVGSKFICRSLYLSICPHSCFFPAIFYTRTR